MKPVIRQGVFETNSSSSHSLCIAIGQVNIPNYEGQTITISPGEFGWEVETHYDLYTKLSYLYTDAMSGLNRRELEGIEGNVLPESMYNSRLEMLVRLLHEQTKCSEVVFEIQDERFYPFGYVDHQSVGTSNEAFESDENMVNFLFNRSSFVHTDNDNH